LQFYDLPSERAGLLGGAFLRYRDGLRAMTVIEGSRTSLSGSVAEYRHYPTLFLFLTLRDITLRYRQTALGVVWAVVQPILPMVIFTVVFARVLRPQTGNVPYSLFALAGLAPWTFFANAISAASMTFVTNHNLLNKIYFPRAILPGAAVAACVLDWLIAGVFLFALLFWRGYWPTTEWLWLPVITLVTTGLAMAVGLAAASMIAIYRDTKQLFPFLVQLWMYATPVVYPAKMLPHKIRWCIGLNPMAGVVEAFRSCLFGTPVDRNLLALSGLTAVCILVAAVLLFHRMEADMAERV
jgi:homopolymeric O-antigen transport system permease protein